MAKKNKEKYTVVYADPPWYYRDKAQAGKRGVEFKYPVMRIKDIKDLPVKDIVKDNSILFLWVTFPQLQNGLDVIDSWGFKYKTLGFNWIKMNKKSWTPFWGMGSYTRSNPEVCLIGTKGKTKNLIKRHNIHSVIQWPISTHSKKPDIVREKIELLCGDVKRIELFATKKAIGWTSIGNKINGNDISDVLNKIKDFLA